MTRKRRGAIVNLDLKKGVYYENKGHDPRCAVRGADRRRRVHPHPAGHLHDHAAITALAGILLGARAGALSQAIYVALGLLGVPIFAAGGGFQYVFNPTFGFLVGLIPAAWVVGALTEKDKSPKRAALACFAGLAVLYLIGVPYMGVIVNAYMGRGLTLWQILKSGMLIYLPGDCGKIALCAVAAPQLARSLSRA